MTPSVVMGSTETTDFTAADIARGEALFKGRALSSKAWSTSTGCRKDGKPEIAFAGRSNVGKSSLINALTGRTSLARVSVTPGRTRELNFFTLGKDDQLYLVDMPGYGYAKAPKSQVKGWTRLIGEYLKGRRELKRVFLLIDARHGIKANDRETMKLMDEAAVSYQVVLTKADKPKASELAEFKPRSRRARQAPGGLPANDHDLGALRHRHPRAPRRDRHRRADALADQPAKRAHSAAIHTSAASARAKNTAAEARSLVMRMASCRPGWMWLHRRSIAVFMNSTDSTKNRLAISATQVHRSLATKKDSGTSRQAMATSCLIADSVLSPSRNPPSEFQKAATIRARPPLPGSADCGCGRPSPTAS